MKRKSIKVMMFISLFIPHVAFSFFCPTNFNQINFGDTIDQVNAQCGKAAKQDVKEVQPKVPEEWTFFVPQTVSSNYMTPSQGTLKTSMSFDANGNAINISVNGIGVGSTTICGSMIQLGDNEEKVKAACGKPTYINKSNPTSGASQKPEKITTLMYDTNPPVKLIFKDGVLTDKQ